MIAPDQGALRSTFRADSLGITPSRLNRPSNLAPRDSVVSIGLTGESFLVGSHVNRGESSMKRALSVPLYEIWFPIRRIRRTLTENSKPSHS
jgi:hypothetical protein